jgi:oxygen-independent coproporphyrinogen-3 oxidase
MAGIYLHIPFCKQACHYCNFHFSTSTTLINDFPDALLKEIELRKDYLEGEEIATVYFGGGTPSMLPVRDIEKLIAAIQSQFRVRTDVEITLEANPDDINSFALKEWKAAGVNRLSIGTQSFFDSDLAWMNRAHNASQAEASIVSAQENGFTNITIDLIFGTPGLDNHNWLKNLEKAIKLQVPHLSCYALTVENKTALEKMIRDGRLQNVDDVVQSDQFLLMVDFLEGKGYEHYEISNFALAGFRSRHNSSYWSGAHYLGIGPSAHSFNGVSRQWNVANNALYLQSIKKGTPAFEVENLSDRDRFNEFVLTSIRTMEGVSLRNVELRFGKNAVTELLRNATRFETDGLLTMNGSITLTRQGKLFADKISAGLFR